MYTDNTLTPKEAVRLCALGTLSIQPMPYGAQSSMSYGAQSSMPYGALAESIRHFVSHVIGPSLDVMGQSIELLRYEGLVDFIQNDGEDDDHLCHHRHAAKCGQGDDGRCGDADDRAEIWDHVG